tara:strand:- start:1086 stop:1658 length:573 start_codon:yes stop_codon:yes gene_type:complete
MKSIYNYIISCDNRYNNSKQIDNKELILNTEITERDYHFVNRVGKILSTPICIKTPAEKGDEVILHHNVFRRWYDIRGKEKNSAAFINENEYIVSPEEIFAYKNNNKWKCFNEFCFVKPLKDASKWSVLKEKKLLGKLVYSNEYLNQLGLSCGDVVGFTPDSEYEFNIENQKLYRILSNQITYVKNTKSN